MRCGPCRCLASSSAPRRWPAGGRCRRASRSWSGSGANACRNGWTPLHNSNYHCNLATKERDAMPNDKLRHLADVIYWLQQSTQNAVLLQAYFLDGADGRSAQRLDMLLENMNTAFTALRQFTDAVKREHEAHEKN